jgi:RNA polymerase sigma-70 factor, ECF subfamily
VQSAKREAADFDNFYRARYQSLTYALYLMCGDWVKAEEVVQEAFLRAWKRWDALQADDPVSWVRTVAWRICVDDWRTSRRVQRALQRLRQERDPQAGHPDSPGRAQQALAALSEPLRLVAILHYVEDLPVGEISRILNIPEGTVKSRLSRARDVLRQEASLKRKEEFR